MREKTVKLPLIFSDIREFFLSHLARYPIFHQFSKFTFVGILNTIVGYGSYFILVGYINYLLAAIISHCIGVTHSYLWNKYWVFKSSQPTLAEFIRFNIVYLNVLIANIVILFILVEYFTINPRIAQLIVLPITAIISYFGHRKWSFKT
jgi:putative flippase GtrA